jgi:hypothetical protein
VPKNGRRDSGSSEGGGANVTRRRFHQRCHLSLVASKCCYGKEEKWKMADVYRHYRPQQMLSKG